MIVRTATQKDVDAITAIWNTEISEGVSTFNSEPKNKDEVSKIVKDRGLAFIVAAENDQVLGFATFGPFRGGIGYRHTAEHSIYITPAAAGRGLGRALMAEICARAEAQGIHMMVGAIGGENTNAIEFHSTLGFVQTGHMPQLGRKFDRWMDLILMQKSL